VTAAAFKAVEFTGRKWSGVLLSGERVSPDAGGRSKVDFVGAEVVALEVISGAAVESVDVAS